MYKKEKLYNIAELQKIYKEYIKLSGDNKFDKNWILDINTSESVEDVLKEIYDRDIFYYGDKLVNIKREFCMADFGSSAGRKPIITTVYLGNQYHFWGDGNPYFTDEEENYYNNILEIFPYEKRIYFVFKNEKNDLKTVYSLNKLIYEFHYDKTLHIKEAIEDKYNELGLEYINNNIEPFNLKEEWIKDELLEEIKKRIFTYWAWLLLLFCRQNRYI